MLLRKKWISYNKILSDENLIFTYIILKRDSITSKMFFKIHLQCIYMNQENYFSQNL